MDLAAVAAVAAPVAAEPAHSKGVEVPDSPITPPIGVVVPVTTLERNKTRDDESEFSESVEAPEAGPDEAASRAKTAGSTKPGPMAMSSISMRAVKAT